MLLAIGPKHASPKLTSWTKGEYMTHIAQAMFQVCGLDQSTNTMKMVNFDGIYQS